MHHFKDCTKYQSVFFWFEYDAMVAEVLPYHSTNIRVQTQNPLKVQRFHLIISTGEYPQIACSELN
jgi:hypothetical protein